MSERVVELPSQGARSSAPEFERTPPQDIAAEQSVLGGMLLSKDAIADVVEVVRATDFYKPAHQTIFDVVVDLYGKGEPADPITVSAELTRLGEIGRVGGAPYLHTLLSSVPTAANAGFYARIVAEQAVLRRLVEAGTRIVQLGYGAAGSGGVDDTVDRAQQAIYDVTERRSSEDYTLLEQLMQPTMDELEAIGSRGGSMSGVPTGFVDLDGLTNGLHPGQLIVIAGRPGLGKALALDTPLPTPTGWTTMGEVAVGDRLLDADGRPTAVLAATDVLHGRPCFALTFDDGTSVVADSEHQWRTCPAGAEAEAAQAGTAEAGAGAQVAAAAVRTTAELARALHAGERVAVAHAACLTLPEVALPAPPYALGAWLAHAHAPAARSLADPELVVQLESVAAPARPADLTGVLRGALRSSQDQRRALLAGLMDVAGGIEPDGALRLVLGDPLLAQEVRELVVSLGHSCTTTSLPGAAPAVVLSWRSADRVFRLEDKHLEHKDLEHKDLGAAVAPVPDRRQVVAVRPVPSVPVRCVEVDDPDHLYLATRAMVPTHNSTLGLDIARATSVKSGLPSAIFSLEMSKTEITMRLLSAEARVPLHHMRSGTMTDDDWNRLARRMGEVAEAPLYIDDSPNLTMMEIRSKARRLRQRNDLRLIVIDYLQLMSGNKKAESRQQEVSELSRSLKLLAKELEIPVIAMSQLNRGAEQRTDKKPQIADLRESGCLTASTRVLRADTGGETSLGELFATGATDVPVWSLDDSLRYVRRCLTHVFATGRKPVFRLRLASGKQVDATANHPFLTHDGWRPLRELAPGTRLAVPRHVPAPLGQRPLPEAGVEELARLDRSRLGPHETFVPDAVAQLPKAQIRLFLHRLWATGGSVGLDDGGAVGQVRFSSLSRRLCDDVSRLLLRFGISTVLSPARTEGSERRWTLDVPCADDQRRFVQEIGPGSRQPADLARLRDLLAGGRGTAPVDTVPPQVWQAVRGVLAETTTCRVGAVAARDGSGHGPSAITTTRERLAQVVAVMDEQELELLATNDVLWDEVVGIEPLGEQEVYDATVLGTHNFIADGIAVHNSIEQDADMVILLHREDAYEKESPRAGEADFIVAKHRNGPTATITVAFQGHYSRFVDMNPA